MSKKVLVTGATGNIGSQLVQELRKASVPFLEATTEKDQQGVGEKVFIDFLDKDSLVQAFKQANTVFLLFPMVEQMIEYAKNAVEAAKAAGVQTLVRSSGAGADSNAGFMMPKVQGTIDDLITQSGIPYVITQPSGFMQNFVNFMADSIKTGAVYMPVGDGKLGWVDVRDIARVNAAILKNPQPYLGQKITITGGENLSFAEAIKILSDTIGKPVQFVDVPEEAARDAMQKMGMPAFIIDMTESLNRIIKAGYAAGVADSVLKITGQSPIAFRQFVADYKQAWL